MTTLTRSSHSVTVMLSALVDLRLVLLILFTYDEVRLMSIQYQGHDLAYLRNNTQWKHCRICGGCGYLDKPNSLGTDCPGKATDLRHLNNIFTNKLDYRRGKWVQRNASQ